MKAVKLLSKAILIDKNIHLLVIILVSFLLYPFFPKSVKLFGISLVSLVFLFTILAALRTIIKDTKKFRVYVSIACTSMALSIVASWIPEDFLIISQILKVCAFIIFIMFYAFAIYVMLTKLFQSRSVTMDSILGGICIYFLLGHLWLAMYHFIVVIDPNAISATGSTELFYFSYTTLTTLGFGDIVPQNGFAMVLVNLEAIVGQMYIAVLIARLVGLYVVHETLSQERLNKDSQQ